MNLSAWHSQRRTELLKNDKICQKVNDPPPGHLTLKIIAGWCAFFAIAFTAWRNQINATIIQKAIGELNVSKALSTKNRTFLIYCLNEAGFYS
jgi:hypothetical protein